jgi:UDP-N-acetylmuramate dehydrogenase
MAAPDLWREGLRQRLSGTLLFDEPADRHTSFGVGGRIDALVFPEDEKELAEAVTFLRRNSIPFLAVGNWTNLIVRGGGYRGVLIAMTGMRRLTKAAGEGGRVSLAAQAGVPLAELVSLSVREALTGMEFCAGIPGSVGGAVRMNAGAYGGEIKDVCTSARIIDDAGIRNVPRAGLFFSYRNLDLPAESIIIGATFTLSRGAEQAIEARVSDIMARRREKHPLEYRSAGSVFKNPSAIPAGRLIDEAGLKGMRIGGAEVSVKHGNFIVNRGDATAEDILRLIALVQERVREHSGNLLETEVRIIGES